jgi:hypothetical protein
LHHGKPWQNIVDLVQWQDIMTFGHSVLINQGNDMKNEAMYQAGSLFADSETSADEALEVGARAIGDKPTFDHFMACRAVFVDAYVSRKPNAKGDASDQAWKRFKDRLVAKFAVTIPQAPSKAATKKRAERSAKQEALLKQYEHATPAELTDMLRKQYEAQAKNPMIDDKKINELKAVLKARTKGDQAEQVALLKSLRADVSKLAKACGDPAKLRKVIALLK